MTDSDSAYNKFQALRQEAISQQENLQGNHKGEEIENLDTDTQIMLSQLRYFSRLADTLKSSDVIDNSQYDQMQLAVANLKEVIEKIDPAALSKALESVN